MSNQQTAVQKLSGGFSLVNTVLAIALSIGGTLLTIGVTQGNFAQRLTTAETEVKAKVSTERYDADQRALKEILDGVKKTVDEIRRDQVEDLKRRADRAEALNR